LQYVPGVFYKPPGFIIVSIREGIKIKNIVKPE